jgi:hypothetical protein
VGHYQECQLCIRGVPEEKEREKEAERTCEEIMTKKPPKSDENKPQVGYTQRDPQLNTSKSNLGRQDKEF